MKKETKPNPYKPPNPPKVFCVVFLLYAASSHCNLLIIFWMSLQRQCLLMFVNFFGKKTKTGMYSLSVL